MDGRFGYDEPSNVIPIKKSFLSKIDINRVGIWLGLVIAILFAFVVGFWPHKKEPKSERKESEKKQDYIKVINHIHTKEDKKRKPVKSKNEVEKKEEVAIKPESPKEDEKPSDSQSETK